MSKLRLGDVTTKIGSGATPRGGKEAYMGGGYSLIRSMNIHDNYFDRSNLARINNEQAIKLNNVSIQENDVLINITGASVARVNIAPKDILPARVNQHVSIIRPVDTKLNPHYLHYYLIQPAVKKKLLSISIGSSREAITKDYLSDFVITAPGITEQQDIAKTLKLLDDKILLNNELLTELESTAKLIYSQWFIQFDFPDSIGNPYKTSGGELIDWAKPRLKIPKGWSVGNILEFAALQGGGTPSKLREEYWNGDIPFFTPSDARDNIFCITTESRVTPLGIKNSSARIFDTGTVFVTARGSVGNIMVAGEQMAMNQSCYAFVPKTSSSTPFVYFSVLSMVSYLKAKSSGSTFNSIVTNDIKFTPLVIPPTSLINQFSETVEPIFSLIVSTTYENKELSSLRDWLLPMLMNGQIKMEN